MDKIIVCGGKKLCGEVEISAAKNSILPILAATLLCEGSSTIQNVPLLEDVEVLCDIMRSINTSIQMNMENMELNIDTSKLLNRSPVEGLVKKMRASFLLMGPMLARFGQFKITQPGGCNIGTRPVELHLKGLAALGAEITSNHGFIIAEAPKLIGSKIYLDYPSVGATENLMMASVMAEGETIIENAAEEPEIIDLANFLTKMGAIISGAGTGTIKIEGVSSLKATSYKPIYDRIEAGTYMVAAAITGSTIKIKGIIEEHVKPLIAKLTEIGVMMEFYSNSITIDGSNILKPADIKTMPYPGFPTDMQPQMMSLLSVIKGTSVVTETIFENRFMHVQELKKLGANIKTEGRCAIVEGIDKLTGASVVATDLRAGAALVLAGLCAEGYTEISDVYHIDRGYMAIEEKLRKLGADIKRTNDLK